MATRSGTAYSQRSAPARRNYSEQARSSCWSACSFRTVSSPSFGTLAAATQRTSSLQLCLTESRFKYLPPLRGSLAKRKNHSFLPKVDVEPRSGGGRNTLRLRQHDNVV